MRLHYLQHVAAEDLANIGVWADERGFTVTGTRLHEAEPMPQAVAFDWLVVMGGPMNVYEEDHYPWLRDEKALIREAINSGKTVVGVCLGAQLLADVLGGKVTRNPHAEIGWFPVELTEAGRSARITAGLPHSFMAFHWHGDRFDIPSGAQHLFRSEACEEQGFLYGDRVMALQCHLEETRESVDHLLKHFAHEMTPGPYVQDAETIRAGCDVVPEMNGYLARMLDGVGGFQTKAEPERLRIV